MFAIEAFEKLKTHLPEGAIGLGFALNGRIQISISDNRAYGRSWEMRIFEEPARRMCILTEKDGQLVPDYRFCADRPGGGYDFRPLDDPDFERAAQSLFTETLAHLERTRAEKEEANRRATEQLRTWAADPDAMARWHELLELLAPDAEKILKDTSRAFAKPQTFIKRLRLERVTDDVPWRALMDALRKQKRLAVFDWRADDALDGVDELCAQAGRPSLDRSALPVEGSVAEQLAAASAQLARDGVGLVQLDDGSDSYAVLLLPTAGCERAASLAAAFGWRIMRDFA